MQLRRSFLTVRSILLAALMCGAASAVQAAVPAPWLAQDVGAPSPAGTSSYNSGVFTIAAGGADIWSLSDQFRFVYQPMSGDFSVVARVDSLAAVDQWSKAGVMIRESLAANSRQAFALMTGSNGYAFQRRLTTGGSSAHTSGGAGAAPGWVRLIRTGTRFDAHRSADGVTWTLIGSDNISMASTVYVGLAVTSHLQGTLASANFSSVAVGAAGGPVPSPQKAADIGAPAIKGSTIYASGQYTINAGGVDIWDTSDQFHYVYQPVSGDVEIVARVVGLGASDTWAKAGVMVRETLAADSRHADALITAGSGYTFQRRIDPAGFTVSNSGFSGAAPAWVRLVRTGYKFDAYRSTDGQTWTPMGSDTVPMTDPIYVGLAVTSHNATLGTTSIIDNLTIKSGTSTNQPPTVTLTSPAGGSSFTAPATISLAANASDPENRLSHVDFYAGTTLLNSDTTAPYSFTWSSVPAGTYSLTAVASDADGGTATSAAVTVTVSGATSDTQPPTAPAGLTATATSSTQINLAWTASTDNTGVTGYRIERCQGASCTSFAQVGTSTTPGYSVTALTASTSYSFRVRAADAAGNLSAYSSTASATTQGTTSAAIAFVQVNATVPQSPVAAPAVAFTGTQSAGDLNVIVVGWNDTVAHVQSVADSMGNAYALAVGPTVNSAFGSQAIYYAKNIKSAGAGANVVTVTFDQPAQYADIRIAEYRGIDTTNPVDVTATAQGNSSTSGTGAVTTTSGNALLVGANMTLVGASTGAGASFTNRVITSPDGDILEDRIVAATGSYSASVPLGGSGPWIMQMVAFRAAGGAPAPPDTQAPTAPTGVTASAMSGSQVNLGWTASTDNAGVTSYLIERCQGSGCTTFSQVGTSATTSYSVTGLTASTSYSFRVRAMDAAGNLSPYSTVATATTSATSDTQAPTTPSNVAATATSTTQINVTWTASTDNVGVASYLVERCQGSGCTSFAQVGTPTGTSFNDTTGLAAGTTYSYRVRAKDGAGNLSAYSTAGTATTQTAATTPKQVVFTASSDHNTSLVTSYRLDVFASGANPSSATPVATSDLGKPTPGSNGDITVDQATLFSALAAGNYVATVSAIGPGGTSRSTSVTFTR